MNGRFGEDKIIGKFTCKNASVVDYILLSAKTILSVIYFNVLPFCYLNSDVHCILKCELKISRNDVVAAPITHKSSAKVSDMESKNKVHSTRLI